MVMSRRLSYAEAKLLEETQGRFCPGCRVIFPLPDIPISFARDKRTRDGLSTLCLACTGHRDTLTENRGRVGRASAQAERRTLMREVRIAAARAHLDKYLSRIPPEHAIPECALDDYPTPKAHISRRPADNAIPTRLYGRLRDGGAMTWEKVAGARRNRVVTGLGLGVRSLDQIDEHLRAFGLDLLKLDDVSPTRDPSATP